MRRDVAHEPWPLREAAASVGANTLLAAAGIEPLEPQALAHVSPGVHARVCEVAQRPAGQVPAGRAK